jgi:hypothetical protein
VAQSKTGKSKLRQRQKSGSCANPVAIQKYRQNKLNACAFARQAITQALIPWSVNPAFLGVCLNPVQRIKTAS